MRNSTPRPFDPLATRLGCCAVASITPEDQHHIHTYYDVCPWSPSGRYLLALRLPFVDRRNGPEDPAELCLFDLAGRTVRPLWQTTAWGLQTGAHARWGSSDRHVYFNDRRDGKPVGVRLDTETGQARHYDGTVWLIDPGETFAVSPCLVRCNLTQFGYGMSVAAGGQIVNLEQAAEDDGFYRTDLASGGVTLLVSLADVRRVLPQNALAGSTLYAFHCKLNAQGTRLLLVVRAWYPRRRYRPALLTCRADGSELRCVLTPEQWLAGAGSGHPTWHPDGTVILMNHAAGGSVRKFCLIDPDSGQARAILNEPPGTGHPTISANGQWLLTDVNSTMDRRRPATIRLIDLFQRTCRDLARVDNPLFEDEPLRCDAHPVWDRRGRLICFQGMPGMGRQLFVADPARPPGEMPSLDPQQG